MATRESDIFIIKNLNDKDPLRRLVKGFGLLVTHSLLLFFN